MTILILFMRTPAYTKEVLACFQKHHLLSLQELAALVPEADQSTLYRNVVALTKKGELRAITVGKNRVLYERADHNHDHLVCSDCGKVEAIDLPRPAGGHLIIDTVLAHGACQDCSKTRL